ncbi:MAG: hypothetical protein M1G31_34040 [Pseudanabaena sp. Salubria-1]|jgi:hypothetical protein|nr:hypothetical protein [Pseudanabaena sp. Salubria-1]MCX5935586.1 hypothetical protein [Pseudanabaena sp. LacPavin_0818_WC45_MAG_42_6]
MKLKKLTKNLSLGQAKRRTALGFNILSDRGTVKVNVTEENSVMLKSFLDFLWNDAQKNPLNLVSYTSEMDARVSALTEGVEID